MIGILLLLFGPAVIFMVIAINSVIKKNKKTAKVFFILAGIYLLISLGTCGIMLANFKLH